VFFNLRQRLSVLLIKGIQRYGPRVVDVLGMRFEVSEDVFNPRYYITSEFMARHLDVNPDDDVLDMGTGSGIQAIVAARIARRVIAIDINPVAVMYATKNVRWNGVEDRVVVLNGDLFEPLTHNERFDIIIFTPPYMEGIPRNNLELALYDPSKSLVKRFFSKAGDYLKADGYVQMLYSSIAEPERMVEVVRGLGWRYELIANKDNLTERFMIYRLRPDRFMKG